MCKQSLNHACNIGIFIILWRVRVTIFAVEKYMILTKFLGKSKHIFGQQHFSENRAIYGIMLKYIVEPDRTQLTILRMAIACWVIKAIT
jgi:hypothetical protein